MSDKSISRLLQPEKKARRMLPIHLAFFL